MTQKTTELDIEKRGKLVAQVTEGMPYSEALGLRVVECFNGAATMTLPYDEKLIGDPETGVIHGGAVSALMDTTCGAAVMCHPKASMMTATLDLRIDYMRPATKGQSLKTTATCYHVTRTVAFVRAITVDEDESRPVASATGAFTVDGGKS